MQKWKIKILEKIKEKGKGLFLGKTDTEAIDFLSEQNPLTAAFTKINEKNFIEKEIKKEEFLAIFVKDFDEIKEKFDFCVVFHEDFMGRKGTEEFLTQAGKKTKLNGKIYFICKTSRGAKNFAQTMKEVFGNSETLGIRGGVRLIASVKKTETEQKKREAKENTKKESELKKEKGIPGKPEKTKEKDLKKEKKEEKLIEFDFRNNKYFFTSSFGVFSKNKVDEGTKLLLENLNEIKEKRILDFGCGLGVIGIVLAKENSEAEVVLIDSDAKAVQLTEKNTELNKVNNTETFVSDGFQGIKGKFDLIVSNLPTHEKRKFLEKFVSETKERLNEKGRIVIVVNKAVFLEKELKQVFGNYTILGKGKEHKVIEAEKSQ
jgi:16S rRNA (guanine1207-N2)-methyltransferase